MNVKDNRRVRLTKQLIKDSLVELMAEKPINRITVKEICSCADINRSTFYLHYTDQYALLQELENDTVNITPRINLYEGKELYNVLVDFFIFISENKKIYTILLENSSSFRGKVLDKVFGKSEEKPVWISGMSLENEMHFKMLLSALGGASLIEKWVFGEIESTPQELAIAFQKFIFS